MVEESRSQESSAERTTAALSPIDSTGPNQESGHEWNGTHAHDWFERRPSGKSSRPRSPLVLRRTQTPGRRWWKFGLRPWEDDAEQSWWFASTAIPLLAATIGPLANVLSIAALVTPWRMCLVPGVGSHAEAEQCVFRGPDRPLNPDLNGVYYSDPRWCYYLNVASLVVGFVGNIFLLCNFTQRIRYIIALPVTIASWYIATGILIGITASMELHVSPVRPQQTYSQGFWYAVIAACMYLVCSMLLMVNMLGYFLGHYPQHFQLSDSQRTLILQTMLFFLWLAGGGAIFSYVETTYGDGTFNWSYVNALYFCDVTILTVGFGDLYATSDIARGLLFPYSVGGIIMLGLMVSSISKFATEIGSENIVQRHVEHSRVRTIGRTVTTSLEMERRQTVTDDGRPTISAPISPADQARSRTIRIAENDEGPDDIPRRAKTLKRVASLVSRSSRQRKPKLILLREEKDRFDAMRKIQHDTSKFKRWYALFLSVTAFAILWCGGAVVFWRAEHAGQGLSYFQALYFCYVSLLTIGYGDLAPQSNPGRPFFVFWSLIAIPTMTILVSDLGETVINKFKHGTFALADFTVLPQKGVWRAILDKHPWMLDWLQQRKEKKQAKRRLEEDFRTGPEPDTGPSAPTIEQLAKDEPSNDELARRLAKYIRQTANDLKDGRHKRYTYEEWVEFTQLIKFTASKDGTENEDEDDELIDWDWIGEDSPMMARKSEPEFVLDRLCESMQRYIRQMATPAGEPELKQPPAQIQRSMDEPAPS
ncbi:Potassium channel [Saxophila tyrrhenica]|uniref:Potassium channel n=1 Tax=Saxophila tyrrhenica TaxID=1690608 RepID=A0AAV9PQR3_9PEZI|nr:Potassium channel [Saxophila tyrrhenica]